MRTRIVIAVAAGIAGCAQPPVVDNTPENPTAVFETVVSSSGIAGMFPFETTDKHYVRADMRRDERAGRGTGTFSGFLVTRMMGPGDASIARADRKLLWMLNHGRKEYLECPLQGCAMPGGAEAQKPQAQREEQKQKAEDGCVMRVASTKFDVTPTGEKRVLNGFNTEQYQGAWVVRMQDSAKRITTSTVKLDVWTTAMNAQMRQALDTEAAFGRALRASAPGAAPAAGKPAAGQQVVMPPEVITMMTGYLANLSPADRAAFSRGVRELDKIKGHPISTKIDCLLDGNACGAKDEPPPQQTGTSGMLSGIAGSLFAKKEESGPKPLLSFTIEVKQLGVQPVRDSVFSVPASYKLAKQ